MNESTHDEVKNPKHYDLGNGLQTIDFIKASLTPEQWEGYLKGSVLKYMSRAGKKAVSGRDYEKAAWYLEKLEDLQYEKDLDQTRTKNILATFFRKSISMIRRTLAKTRRECPSLFQNNDSKCGGYK